MRRLCLCIAAPLVVLCIVAVPRTAAAADAKPTAAVQAQAKPGGAGEQMGAACADCHEATVKGFRANIHSKVAYYGVQGSCESCHPGAAEHAQSGDPKKVTNIAKLDSERGSEICLHCHKSDRVQTFWRGSIHESREVGCASCHAVHGNHGKLLARNDEGAVCFQCHMDVRSDLMKRSKHPMRDSTTLSMAGKMTCSSCHNPHGSRSRALVDARSVNDKCYECHFEKKAPVLWEHSPVKEDCLVCHKPHGSTNDKLLVQKVPRLCQDCHMQGRHQSGALPMNSTFAVNRSCLNCHPQIHGSNSPSGTVLQR